MKESAALLPAQPGPAASDGKNLVMGLIADQNPPRRPDSRWFRFLNQDTIFFDGGEKLALRCKLPVYFVKMEPPAAGPLRDVLRTDLRR